MERNRWETALRCLEVALHPNTRDDEVIAGVNGFRRIAGATPLTELCAEFALKGGSATALVERAERLTRENLELRRRLEAAEADRIAAFRRADETEQSLRFLGEEMLVAERRASEAERRLAEFGSAYAEITGSLRREIAGLRGALAPAPDAAAAHEAASRVPSFQDFLATALDGAGRARIAVRHPKAIDPVRSGFETRQPWTA